MAFLTPQILNRINDLISAGNSGQLGTDVGTFLVRSMQGITLAPESFRSTAEIKRYLKTIRYLIDLHVYRSS